VKFKPPAIGLGTPEEAIRLLQAGRPAESERICRALIASGTRSAVPAQILGMLSFQSAKLDESVRFFRLASQLDPKSPDAWSNLGHVLSKVGQLAEAVSCLREAIKLNPRLSNAYSNLAGALGELGEVAAAIDAGAEAVRLQPNLVEAHVNLGGIYLGAGLVDNAISSFERAIQLDPNHPGSWSNLLMALQYSANRTSEQLLESARQWGSRFPIRPVSFTGQRSDKINIGYVSADLCGHPVGLVMEKLLAGHDRSRFRVFCYANQPGADEVSKRIEARSDQWRYILSLSDADAAELIRRDQIDVLVDLSGHTAGNRLGVFAERAAPLQVTWMGYFATTGLPAMDFILRDPDQIPRSEDWQYTEGVWPLRSGAFSFDLSSVPVQACVPATGPIRFGNFNNLAKISGESLKAWAAVLNAVPGSTLVLARKAYRCESVRDRISKVFEELGVDRNRILFKCTFGGSAYFDLYRQVDVILDTFPFNGGTTTYEALASGVPVVAHRWDRMVGHFAESILRKCGHEDWVANSVDEYVAVARDLTSCRDRLGEISAGLREELERSGLCSAGGCASELEDSFTQMLSVRAAA
jgi:protein O-GlcNAc transferase